MWFGPFPWDSYLLFPAGPADSSNLHISATNFTHVPESPLPTCFSQAPNSQRPNSFAPRNCEVGAWDWKPCFQDIWTAKVNCSFLLLLWQRWPRKVTSLETDRQRPVCAGCHGEEGPDDDFCTSTGAGPVRGPELQEGAISPSSNHYQAGRIAVCSLVGPPCFTKEIGRERRTGPFRNLQNVVFHANSVFSS